MSLRFAGYAAVFDRPDRGGDIVRAGAFSPLPRTVPLLREHRGHAVGALDQLSVDSRGLRVIGRIDDPATAAAVRAGRLWGLSFGYRATAVSGRRYRELKRVDLIEVSLVARPMQPLARLHALGSSA